MARDVKGSTLSVGDTIKCVLPGCNCEREAVLLEVLTDEVVGTRFRTRVVKTADPTKSTPFESTGSSEGWELVSSSIKYNTVDVNSMLAALD